MKKTSVIKAAMMYAEAMYDSTIKTENVETLYDNARTLKAAIESGMNELNKLNNPLWKYEKKAQILEYLAQQLPLCKNMLNTLKILAKNNELNILPQVLNQFILLYQDKHYIAEVEVTTVMPLNALQEDLLKTKLAAIFHKEILLHYIINPQIIGGLVIKYGTNFIDNSVKHKLDALEQLMKGTK
ncbi:MAG: ATP synthase F1 subunit delta [Alphaproteobacteria bacterium]|nr:ATP synthase F1 subunit delta [Alphaproteobacteria bacterium]